MPAVIRDRALFSKGTENRALSLMDCIADPLGKIDPANPVAFDGHIPDLRLHDPFVPFT